MHGHPWDFCRYLLVLSSETFRTCNLYNLVAFQNLQILLFLLAKLPGDLGSVQRTIRTLLLRFFDFQLYSALFPTLQAPLVITLAISPTCDSVTLFCLMQIL
jgi:hypothetical protein